MSNKMFDGIALTLNFNSKLKLNIDEDDMYNATLFRYRKTGEFSYKKAAISNRLSKCLCELEKNYSKNNDSSIEEKYLDSLQGIDWLLSKGFDITIEEDKDQWFTYYSLKVKSKHQPIDLKTDIFAIRTISSYGLSEALDQCNAWACTLMKHVDNSLDHEPIM